MGLPRLTLDDVTWEELTRVARDNIAPASRGAWTHHSPIDPGVTLNELYAWLFDQRVYWLDQVGASEERALLRLLGGAARPAGCAVLVLGVTLHEGASSTGRLIEQGTTFWHRTDRERLGVAALETTWFAPIGGMGVRVGAVDRSADLARGRTIALLPGAEDEDPPPPLPSCAGCAPPAAPPIDTSFELLFEGAEWSGATAMVGVLIDLDGPPGQAPGWAPEHVAIAAPGRLSVRYRASAGSVELPSWHDGTGGLRHSGLFRFAPPADWAADSDGRFALELTVTDGRHSAPPRLRRLVPNALVVAHRRDVTIAPMRVEWLPLPHRSLALELDDLPLAESVTLALVRDGQSHPWRATADLLFHGPADRVFEVDRAAATLRFGDGLMGRVPRLDDVDDNVSGACQVGGGVRGNLPRNNPFRAPDPELALVSLVDGTGGAEPETPRQALARRGRELGDNDRAVTAADYVELAKETPGTAIARAHAAVGVHPSHPCTVVPSAVTVFVVPLVPRAGGAWEARREADSAHVAAPVADEGTLAAVRAHLDARRVLTTEVFVASPRYRRVELAVELRGDPSDQAALGARVRAALRRFLDPLLGGDGDGWPFGEPLRPSALLRVAQLAADGDAVVDAVAIGLDGAAATESCADTPIGAHELVVAGSIGVRLERALIRGGLR
jgi:hypothetical protein